MSQLTIEQSVQIIKNALEIANKAGVYSLEDSVIVKQNIDALTVYVEKQQSSAVKYTGVPQKDYAQGERNNYGASTDPH